MVMRPSKLLEVLRYIWHKRLNDHTFCWIKFSNTSNISSKNVLTSTDAVNNQIVKSEFQMAFKTI